MKYARHPEFPQFRSKLAAMKKVRRQVAAHRSLHSLEKTMARFLPAGLLQELGEMPGRRVRWLPMTLIFWVFLQMVLCPGTSCREAQRATQAWWRRQGRRWLNPNTNAFCQARARLPLAWLQKVWWRLADRICAQAPSLPGCHGRRMLVVDGTTVQTPDTTSNQAQWPQVTSQQPGCGFPLVHLVGFFCLSSGALLRATHGAWKDHEMRLFALLRGTLRRGDVLVADRGFWSFANLAFLPLRGVDLIVRAKYANTLDWRQGQRLGKDDRLVTMSKPDDASRVMKRRWWSRLPQQIIVRQIRLRLTQRGHRDEELVVTTTLLDPVAWPAAQIATLYLRRWRVEMNFDDLKTSQELAVLRCQSPDMILRELLMHAIAYNLIRRLMLESSLLLGAPIERQSFKGTVDTLRAWRETLAAPGHASQREDVLLDMLLLCALDQLPHRPGRHQPRAVKRRPKSYQLLTRHRRLFTESPSRQNKGKPKTKSKHHSTVLSA
jgi:hypothetical protein